ncbi:MAG TPA: biliverdin-producing heme oxygenase [Actinomycetota bacterium]|nr:biliverdin-producing heme oxygenase [Actinomycetota bacterium]
MSAVVEHVARTKGSLPASLGGDLDRKPLSRLLRRETWPDHERAQFSPFEMALAAGTISRAAYLDLLCEMRWIYAAIEARALRLGDHPIVAPVLHDGLRRGEAVEADIAFHARELGTTPSPTMLDVTAEFAARIESVEPVAFVAHHYTRYLADLSGGLIIAAALRRSWGLNGEGMRLYDFSGIGDVNEFKANYRDALDALPLDAQGKLSFIEEVMVAYGFNVAITAELAKRHAIES